MGLKYKRIKGTRDILPPEFEVREQLWQTAREVLLRYGYGFIITPTFEATELFVRSVGENTDIVEKEMYTFTDRGGRSLTLRPEGTAGVVRAYLENHFIPPVKLAYFENVFRAEKPQKGRLREFWQIGVEFIGSDDPLSDAETIELGLTLLSEFGFKELNLEINSIGTPEDRRKYREVLIAYLEGRKDELCEDCQRRLYKNPLRVLDCKIDGPKLKDAPNILDYLSDESRRRFETVLNYLDTWGISYTVNNRLVRGLDYYTHTVFEFKTRGFGAQDTVLAGGRYDGLVEELGGPPTPAVGFALGVERVIIALNLTARPPRPSYFIVTHGDDARKFAVELIRQLRHEGISVDMSHTVKSMKAQMKIANRMGVRFTIIIGEEELSEGKVKVRDMESGEETLLSVGELLRRG